MNDGIDLVYPGYNRPATARLSDPTTTENQTLQTHTSYKQSETKCPPTIGLKGETGELGLLGVDWLRLRVGGASWFQSCSLVLGEMLRHSIELKADDVPLGTMWLSGLIGDELRRTIIHRLRIIGAIKPTSERGPWQHRITHKYRFTEEYKRQPLGTIQLHPKLLERYRSHHNHLLIKTLSAARIYRDLWNDLQHLSLHPSWESAMPDFTPSQWTKEWAWLRSSDKISRRDCYFSCSQAKPEISHLPGRLYTTFCTTPSGLRKYALLDDEPLVCIDVKASQPFLHSTLIPDSEEKRRYLESVCSGSFYEELGRAGNWKGTDREKLKSAVFAAVFYGRTIHAEKNRIWIAFSSLYPMLAEAITHEKRRHHRDLAIKMQYLEAEIILHTALPALKARVPECRVLTVHDAIYVRKEHVLDATHEMVYAFKKHTGQIPALKLENPPLF